MQELFYYNMVLIFKYKIFVAIHKDNYDEIEYIFLLKFFVAKLTCPKATSIVVMDYERLFLD